MRVEVQDRGRYHTVLDSVLLISYSGIAGGEGSPKDRRNCGFDGGTQGNGEGYSSGYRGGWGDNKVEGTVL